MGVQLPSEPITRKEQYLAKAAGQAVEIPAEPITREEAYLEAIANAGGGGGGTSDYRQLTNQPQINGNTLIGNKTASQLGLASTADLAGKVDKVEGYGLSENNYTDTDKAIVGGVTAALAGKQNTLTFDDTPTDGSNNPVKSNGIYDALELKQNATDNNLDTTAKTIVGAINEHEGDIDSLKSGLTNVESKIDDATTYPYADVITIEDAVPSNLADCSVKIEPVQDLHGYDKPWVGGAGKNKLPLTVDALKSINVEGTWADNTYTLAGMTFTLQVDNANNVIGILVNGTTSTYPALNLHYGTLALGNYTFVTNRRCRVLKNSTVVYDGSLDYSFTVDNASDMYIITIFTAAGTVDHETCLPRLLLSTETDATFAPYTNICPISGHTEAKVTRDGKNLCFRGEGNIYNGGGLIPVDVGNKIYCYGKWTSSSTTNMYGAVFDTANQSDKNTGRLEKFSNFQSGNISVCTVSQKGYFGVCFNSAASNYEVQEMMISRTPITSATDYEPYAGKTYTIALGDTIYGGTVDFDSGVMTVDRAFVEYDGSDDENWLQETDGNYFFYIELTGRNPSFNVMANNCETAAIAKTTTNIGVGHDARYLRYRYANDNNLTVSDLKTFLASNNLQVCYYLATPTTIQLTPTQIQLLKGTNTLYASTGDISVTVNGVAGSIGSVQEQVNDHEERIEAVTTVSNGTITAQEGVTITRYILQKSIKTVFLFMLVKFTPTLGTEQLLCVLPRGYRAPDRLFFVGKNGTSGKLVTCEVDSYGAVRVHPTSDDSTAVPTDYFLTITYFTS